MPKYPKTHKAVNPSAPLEAIKDALFKRQCFVLTFEEFENLITKSVRDGRHHGYTIGLEEASKCKSIEEVRDLYWRRYFAEMQGN